jgi:2-keto-3-deoxy-L-rhamnonate aldolase RhmA
MAFERPLPLHKKMEDGPALGTINLIPSPLIVEQLCTLPLDFLWMDMEHGPQTVPDLGVAAGICMGRGINPLVRVPVAEDWAVKWTLDQGLGGIIYPFINTPEEAGRAISASKYPPAGHRGYFPDVAAARWGLQIGPYFEAANDEITVVLQIEHRDAVERVEEIAALDGWDILFVGPMDLSISYGKRGEVDDPEISAAIDRVLRAAHDAGRFAGILAVDPDAVRRRRDEGFDFLALNPDIGIIGRAFGTYWDEIDKALS